MGRRISRFVSGKGEHPSILFFFLFLTLIFTWPLVLHLHDGVLGGTGDPLLNTWIITNGVRKVFTNPTTFFQGNIMYPSRDVITYSEHLFAMALLAAPFYLIFRNPLLCYNLLLVLGAVFSAWGAYLLLKELTGSRWAGLVAGVFFALNPYKMSKVGHLHIMFTPFLPFCLLFLIRAIRDGRWRDYSLFGLCSAGQFLYSWHQTAYGLMALGLAWLWLLVAGGWRARRRLLACLAIMAFVGLMVLPFAIPYLKAHRRLPGFERNILEVKTYSASFGDFLNVLPENLFYGEAPNPFRAAFVAHEKVLFPGVVVIMLAMAALFLGRKGEEHNNLIPGTTLFFVLLGGFSLLMCFGESIRGIRNHVFVMLFHSGFLKFSRVPARFYTLVTLSLSVLAGLGTARILRRLEGLRLAPSMRMFFASGFVLLLALELATYNMKVKEVPQGERAPAVYRWLEGVEGAKVVELPTYPLAGACRYDRYPDLIPENPGEYFALQGLQIYYSIFHRKAIINGYSGYFPPWYNRIFTEIQSFPSSRSISLLRGLGVTHVIWDWDLCPVVKRDELSQKLDYSPELRWAGDFGDRSVYEILPGAVMDDPAALEVEVVVPSRLRPGRPFVAGVLVSNPTDRPYVRLVEDRQPARFIFVDEGGGEVARIETHYHLPLFLEPGEVQVVPLYGEMGLSEGGNYYLEAELEGVLGYLRQRFPVKAEDMPDSEEPGDLSGKIRFLGQGKVRIPHTEGLFPLQFQVANTGDTYWVAARKDKVGEVERPYGLVHLAMRWEKESPVWEEQRGTLPCDLAPGQEVSVPTLVRPPREPGTYKLFVGLADEGFFWFGDVVVLEVEVGGG